MGEQLTTPAEVLAAYQTIIQFLGYDLNDDHLKDTPKRCLNFLQEFFQPEMFAFTTFPAESYAGNPVVVQPIPFFSMCKHHLLPFFGVAAVAYISSDRIVGLSKIPRVVELFARRLQTQEELTNQICHYLDHHLEPQGVMVVTKARHLCMGMRGIKKDQAETTTLSHRCSPEDAAHLMELINV